MSAFKPGTLAARWKSDPEGLGPDIVITYPSAPDGHMLYFALSHLPVTDDRSLIAELERRGYDISTLQFTIRKKVP